MRQLLVRYWIEFDEVDALPASFGVRLGCGVTALTQEDALALVQQKVFGETPMPNVAKIVTNVDVSTLDPGHVIPNMGDPTLRGMWFPGDYE